MVYMVYRADADEILSAFKKFLVNEAKYAKEVAAEIAKPEKLGIFLQKFTEHTGRNLKQYIDSVPNPTNHARILTSQATNTFMHKGVTIAVEALSSIAKDNESWYKTTLTWFYKSVEILTNLLRDYADEAKNASVQSPNSYDRENEFVGKTAMVMANAFAATDNAIRQNDQSNVANEMEKLHDYLYKILFNFGHL